MIDRSPRRERDFRNASGRIIIGVANSLVAPSCKNEQSIAGKFCTTQKKELTRAILINENSNGVPKRSVFDEVSKENLAQPVRGISGAIARRLAVSEASGFGVKSDSDIGHEDVGPPSKKGGDLSRIFVVESNRVTDGKGLEIVDQGIVLGSVVKINFVQRAVNLSVVAHRIGEGGGDG